MAYLYPRYEEGSIYETWRPVVTTYKFLTKKDIDGDGDDDEANYIVNKDNPDEPECIRLCIEYNGRISPKLAYNRAIEALIGRFQSFKEELISTLGGNDTGKILVTQKMANYHYEIRIEGEGHTLGNVIQRYYNLALKHLIIRQKQDTNEQKNILRHCGASYMVPHPLEKYIVISIKFPDSTNKIEEPKQKYYSSSPAIITLVESIDTIVKELGEKYSIFGARLKTVKS